jgi:gliding motility-associated-like protein
VAHDTIYVDRIFCDCPVHIANAFTPNGDGFNEEYSIVFECPPYDYQLIIFDRWGQQIFNTTDPNKKWSGRNRYGDIFPSAVYSYVLKYTEEYQGFLKVRTGSVALLKD